MFRAIDIIIKKRDGKKLNRNEIEFLIDGICDGSIADYQITAFLMAVYFNGMDFEETGYLTEAMINSGEIYELSSIKGIKVDKHSTGGVGDKISLILAPLVASCGVVVPMVSGRGLGHTGGTLDKLQSIPGFRINMNKDEVIAQLDKIGVAMIGQSNTFVPADKKLYALRDVTGTIESIPLITGSILSKKIASGVDALVMDVKVGNGAFMSNLDIAEKLASSLVETGKKLGKKVIAILTDMNQPLGKAVGNSLEMLESIQALKGQGPDDVMDLTLHLAANMLILANKKEDLNSAQKILLEKIKNGEAFNKFKEIVKFQGGDLSVIDETKKLNISKEIEPFRAGEDGFVSSFNTRSIGNAAMLLGAGRLRVEDEIDCGVGMIFNKKIGDKVSKGDIIADIYHRNKRNLDAVMGILKDSINISQSEVAPIQLIKKSFDV